TPENFGKEYSQPIMGIQMASTYIKTSLMPPIFGRFASHAGFTTSPIFTGIILKANEEPRPSNHLPGTKRPG
ncbi:MAG: hypothetical protein LBD55_06105, partial [Treponema sp.]|nr:hypothetical protein [Treponema sp.]